MDHWIAAGVAPAAVFRAATIANAEFFGLEDVGVVAVGKQANLLLLASDPFESVAAFDAIDLVILDGAPIVREALSANNESPQPRARASPSSSERSG